MVKDTNRESEYTMANQKVKSYRIFSTSKSESGKAGNLFGFLRTQRIVNKGNTLY
jgi:hypothetical protein